MNHRIYGRRDCLGLLVLLGMVLWFTNEMVWTGQVPFFRDLGPMFYPMKFTLATSFAKGELPLWDRHVGMGYPLLANFQSGVFYPPNLFFLVLPFFSAVNALFLFHYVIAAVGSYKLCRHWDYPPYLALTGAALYTFGGTIVSLTNLMNHFQAAVWLPLLLLLWERALRSTSWKNFLALVLGTLMLFLAGSPEIYAMSLALMLLDGARVSREEGGSIGYRRVCFLLFTSNALVMGLAMVQLLPTLELLRESRARLALSYGESVSWSLYPRSLINLFFMDREVDVEAFSKMRLFHIKEVPFLLSQYMGVISLYAVWLWLFCAPVREKTILLALIGVSVIIAMGGYTPVYPILFQFVPPFRLFRFPEKFFFVTHALLLFVVLRGLNLFLRLDRPRSRKLVVVLSLVPVLLLVLYILLRLDQGPLIRYIASATGSPPDLALSSVSGALFYLERQTVLVFGVFLLLFLWEQKRLKATLFQALIVSLVFFDLASVHRPYRFLLDPGFVFHGSKTMTAPDTERNRLFYYPGSSIHPSSYTVATEPPVPEFNALLFGNLLPNTGIFHGFEYMQELDALVRWRYRLFLAAAKALPSEGLFRLLSVLNIRYISSFQPLPENGITLLRYFPEYRSWLYRVEHAVPRAYLAQQVIKESDPMKILERLSSARFDPLKEVILEQPVAFPVQKNFQGRAEIIRYENQNVVIKSSLNSAGILVLTDSYYPGWKAYVDGQEKEILQANLFFRAVILPPGEHRVEFRYEPRSFTLGLYISLAFLAALSAWALSRIVRRS